MVDSVEVKLGADAGPAKSSMEDASRSIAASLQAIQKSLENFSTTNKRATDQAIKNNADLSRTFLELKASATGGFDGIIGVIERFRGVWISLAALLAGGALWKSSVDEMLRMEEGVRRLQITFGMLSDQATTTSLALKIIGKTSDDFSAMGMKLARQIKMDEQGIRDLGVVTRDTSTGALLPLDQIMQNAFKTMQDYRAGADQDIVALKLFGRNVGDVVETMIRMPAALERATQLQHELGIEWGPEKQAQVEAYKLEVGAFQVVLGHIEESIGSAVMPQLMNLAKYFNDIGPSAAEFIIKAVKLVIATIDAMATGAKEDYLIVTGAWNNLVISASALWAGMKDAFTTGGVNISNIWADMNKRILKNTLETNAAVLGLEADLIKRLAAMDETHTSAPGAIPGFKSGGKSAPTGKPGGGGDDRLAQWKDELVQMQQAEGYFHEFSKAQEAQFWEAKLALVRTNGDKDVALRRQLNSLIFNDKKAAANEELQADLARMQAEIDRAKNNKDQQLSIAAARTSLMAATFGVESKQFAIAMDQEIKLREQWAAKDAEIVRIHNDMIAAQQEHEVKMDQLALDQAVAMRQVSADQKFAVEMTLEDRLYQIKLKGLEDDLATYEAGTVGYEKAAAKIEALEQAHQEKLTQISNAAALERAQYQLQIQQSIQDGFATLFSDLMQGTKNWKTAFLDAAKSIEKAIDDIVAKKLAAQLFGGGTGGGDFLSQVTSFLFGGGGAGAAGGGGVDNPFLSMFGAVPSFDVGTPYVPRDTLALVHQGEAIIPRSQNRGGIGGGLAVTNHFHISGPVDSRTQSQIAATAARASQNAIYRIM
jgi:hypothetical protein